jgi:Rrf2 family protein
MKINTKVRYGFRAMIEIRSSSNSNGILQKDIAKNQKPIISSLKAKGLISNVKGKPSGYMLIKKPKEITVKDIYSAFEPITILDCLNNESSCLVSCDCMARDYWSELKQQIDQLLSSKTLHQILKLTVCNSQKT